MEQHPWKELFRIAGVALVIAGLLYLGLLVILVSAGGTPAGPTEFLRRLASAPGVTKTVGIVFLVGELCLLGAFPALFLALKELNKAWSLIGTACALVALLFDLLSGLLVYALPGLGSALVSAPKASQPTYQVLGDLVYRYLYQAETPLHVVLVSLAILLLSLAMLQGRSRKPTALFGIVLGGAGVVGGLLGFIPVALLWSFWFLTIGVHLSRLDVPMSVQRSKAKGEVG
jgi:hypothetical protein